MTDHEASVRAWVIRLAAAFGYRIADETLSEYVSELRRVRSTDAVWEQAASALKRNSERMPSIAACFGALGEANRAAMAEPEESAAARDRRWEREAVSIGSDEAHEAMVDGAMRIPGWTRERAERFVKNLRAGLLVGPGREKARRPENRALPMTPAIADYDDSASVVALGDGL